MVSANLEDLDFHWQTNESFRWDVTDRDIGRLVGVDLVIKGEREFHARSGFDDKVESIYAVLPKNSEVVPKNAWIVPSAGMTWVGMLSFGSRARWCGCFCTACHPPTPHLKLRGP